jgi:LPS-assembly lipoprotein
MWWSDRRTVLLGLLALGGCGFTPVYAPGSTASTLRGQVQITAPETVEGYRMLQALRDRLGDSTTPAYDLAVTLDITEVAAATTSAGSTTRYTLPGRATYVLTTLAGAALAEGAVDSFTSYSATGTTVATSAAETDARARLAAILADQIVTRLSVADLSP